MVRQFQASQVPETGAFPEPRVLEGELIEYLDGIRSAFPVRARDSVIRSREGVVVPGLTIPRNGAPQGAPRKRHGLSGASISQRAAAAGSPLR